MNVKRRILQLSVLYLLILVGYLYLYVVDADQLLFPGDANEEVKSKIDFVYEQY